MTRLTDQYPNTTAKLIAVLNDSAREVLTSPDDNESNRALCAWLDSTHEDGYLEIGSQYSASGQAVIVELDGD